MTLTNCHFVLLCETVGNLAVNLSVAMETDKQIMITLMTLMW